MAEPPTRTVGGVLIDWLVREMQRAVQEERRKKALAEKAAEETHRSVAGLRAIDLPDEAGF